MPFYLTSIDSFLQQVEIGKQLHNFKDPRLENVKKKAADVVASKGTSAEIMVHPTRNVKRVFQKRHPKSVGSVLKKKQHKRSSLMAPSNSKKVPVAKVFFISLPFCFSA